MKEQISSRKYFAIIALILMQLVKFIYMNTKACGLHIDINNAEKCYKSAKVKIHYCYKLVQLFFYIFNLGVLFDLINVLCEALYMIVSKTY